MNNLENKLKQIQSLVIDCLSEVSSDKPKAFVANKTKQTKTDTATEDKIMKVVNKVKNCNETEKIEKQILDKRAMEGKIILPFYICNKYFPTYTLSTGDIEKITAELSVRIKASNVRKAIRESLYKFLDTNQRRKSGILTPYKLNRKGFKHFESLLES